MKYGMKPLAEMVVKADQDGAEEFCLRIGDQDWPADFIDAPEVAIDINNAHIDALRKLTDYAETLEALLERAIDERRCDHAAEPCSWCGPVKVALGLDDDGDP